MRGQTSRSSIGRRMNQTVLPIKEWDLIKDPTKQKINQMIADGWQPYGPPFGVSDEDGPTVYQPMVKYGHYSQPRGSW